MFELEFYLDENHGMLELEPKHLEENVILHLHNNPDLAASIIYLTLPENAIPENGCQWRSKIKLDSKDPVELVIMTRGNTHIYNGDFSGFKAILITDSKIERGSLHSIL